MEVDAMNEETKCEGCGGVHIRSGEVFEDVMGNPVCTFCIEELDADEFDNYTPEY